MSIYLWLCAFWKELQLFCYASNNCMVKLFLGYAVTPESFLSAKDKLSTWFNFWGIENIEVMMKIKLIVHRIDCWYTKWKFLNAQYHSKLKKKEVYEFQDFYKISKLYQHKHCFKFILVYKVDIKKCNCWEAVNNTFNTCRLLPWVTFTQSCDVMLQRNFFLL